MDAAGCELPLMWLNYRRGYDVEAMRQRETELQRRVRVLEEQLADERKKNDHIAEFFAKARAA